MPFPTHLLTDDEELVLDLRPHWWFLAPAASVLAIFVLLGLVALASGWPDAVKVLVGLVVLGALGWFGVVYSRWATTNFVVTTERVISRSGLVAKKGIEIPLDRINTVFFSQGVFERMIGQGDLGVESAGEGGRQNFHNIRRPNLVQNEIYHQKEALEARKYQRMGQAAAGGAAGSAPESIPDQIAQLDRLRREGAITEEEFARKKQDLLDRM